MDKPLQRDVFISYCRQDRSFAERLARDLVTHGLSVWWDQWELQVGDSLIAKIEGGIQSSSWLAVVLSPASVESSWVRRELNGAMATEISEERVIVLPLLLADCQLPAFLRDKFCADFRESYTTGLELLLLKLQPPLAPQVLKALESDSEEQILARWVKLSEKSRKAFRARLSTQLTSHDSQDRMVALTALTAIKDPSLPATLTTLCSDSSTAIRSRVAYQLGRLKGRAALSLVETLMQDPNPAVRSVARTAYRSITGKRP
jgi:hypothetical protein